MNLKTIILNYLYAMNLSYKPQKGITYSEMVDYVKSIGAEIFPGLFDFQIDDLHNNIYHNLTHETIPLLSKLGLVARLRTSPALFLVNETI